MDLPEVTVEQGKLRGSTATDFAGKKYFKFQGIPYAEPPLGKLRFKAPVPPKKWSGTLTATKEGSPSFGRHPFKRNVLVGSEDCLYLNVYTKNLSNESGALHPVMFWIHGGIFVFGSGSTEFYGPDFLITEDVDPTLGVPGNAGLKDVVMALKWVHENIRQFGGDPDNITIFGQSSGAAAVHLLTLSPMGIGLFHKAIGQSGTALSPWASGTRGVKQLASIMKLEGESEETILNHLMMLSGEEILKMQGKFFDRPLPHLHRLFGFVIEDPSDEAFLIEHPFDLMMAQKNYPVPFMTGFTTVETMHIVFFRDGEVDTYEEAVPWSFGYQERTEESEAVAQKIKEFYLGNEEASKKNILKVDQMFAYPSFVYGMYVTAFNKTGVPEAPVYLYRCSVETKLNYLKEFFGIKLPGCLHSDEIGYLFKGFTTPKIIKNSCEDVAMRRIVRMWTNFAKYGNPTPQEDDELLGVPWKPTTKEEINVLDIGKNLVLTRNFQNDEMKFWDKLFYESPSGRKYTQ
ncbi:hypothetical protein MTP99_017993 [Tenebrio molitor]|nr:hypothetical protein MTP99_017993 [Tenebrio molitor]